MSDRPKRSCDVCGQIDDHPRHTFIIATDGPRPDQPLPVNQAAIQAAYEDKSLTGPELVRIVKQLEDVTEQQRHMDCCRAAGCPDGSCNRDTVAVEGLKGDKLLKAILAENPEG